ncbi:glycosyltransferase family 2 protein [Pseudonocardia sp. Cha107L01]|uniref:glycosyltransferase family 2 protein n=1 Tax=Pseudonocardia sp. Cha107L01 TaxID=3457576 RepID=UPI00403E9C74
MSDVPALVDPIPTGTVIIPAYNEAENIAVSLHKVVEVLESALADRRWEIVIVDDGSQDATSAQARAAVDRLGASAVRIRVLRHLANQGLGGALQTGFKASTGDVVVVIDCDLSYHPDHIPKLVRALESSHAEVAVASPYMVGGSTRDVPAGIERRSRIANSFLSAASNSGIATLTGMVRAYRGPFIRGLALRATDDGINVEALYKTGVLRGRVQEVPAVLDWGGLAARAGRSRMRDRRVRTKTYNILVSGLMFRPYLAFALGMLALIGVGGALGLTAMLLPGMQLGLTVLGVSLLGTGILVLFAGLLSIQVKRSFEELYFLLGHENVGVPRVAEDEGTVSADRAGLSLVHTETAAISPDPGVITGSVPHQLSSRPGLGAT